LPRSFDPNAFSKMKSRAVSKLVLLLLCLARASVTSRANPHGLTVTSGSAHTVQHGHTLQVTTSQNAVLQWNSFNIAPGEVTVFRQPSTTSVVFNNINNLNPTTIYGSLLANGIVVLENQAGFYFGPHAFVKAGGLVVTTAAIDPWASTPGAAWSFDGPPTLSPIVNYGCLETASGGSLFLIGKEIENQGIISAPGGTAALIAGQDVLLSERPNGLSLSAPVRVPAGSVNNQGQIVADAGQVLLQAQNVNNSGIIQANSVREQNGVIELYASQEVQLAASSVIEANGSPGAASQGGNIAIKSGDTFSDAAGSLISAAGGANGGNGGKVEVSAPNILSLASVIDAGAQPGWREGLFSLDPDNIVLGNFSSGSTSAGTTGVIDATGSPGTVNVDVGSAFQNITASILLEASGTITLNSGIDWNLSLTTGKTTGQLTLEAGGSITLNNGSIIEDPNNWSVTLEAGYNFAAGGGVVSGTSAAPNNVTLLGTAAIETAAGNINVLAGNNVTVGSGGIVTGIANGAVMTGTGGNVNVQALTGTVNCGNSGGGFDFISTGDGYDVSPSLGGISTASGGNVTIQAGGNIIAALPGSSQGSQTDFGSGAFGAAPGNVTLTAGGNVTGHFVLADGTGTITGGLDAGTATANLALSLINGGWTVHAADDIYLQEVRNPNGVFNSSARSDPVSYLFNYDPLASVTLDAGDGVTITGSALPRVINTEPLIFPPVLTIDAGAGGISLDTTVNLFPAPDGTLNLTTTGGGTLQGVGLGVGFNLSDSSRVSYSSGKAFQFSDPDTDPLLHLNDPNPVLINISGSVENLTLDSSKPVEMYAAGNIVDCGANIQNLGPADTTTISAGGEIVDHEDFVVAQLQPGQTPNFAALDQVSEPVLPGPGGILIQNPNLNGTLENIQANFTYDRATGTLLFLGVLTALQEKALLAIHFLDQTDLDYIQQQGKSEYFGAPLTYTISGPGTLKMDAASISLGNGGGIISQGFGNSPVLASVTPRGADLDISVGGDINMVASSIQSEYGGAINIACGGAIDVGSPVLGTLAAEEENDAGYVFGIVSIWGANISVIANGNIDVDSSRIAAYDGGNIFVESLQGNVDAGAGGSGSVQVTKTYLNAQGQVELDHDFIPGSGILATSYPQLVYGQTSGQLGNITVETPEGNIEASQGGIVQIALGPVAHNDATINLSAGSKNPDGTVAYVGNVNASGSGVIGGQVNISATGDVTGLVVATLGANVSALQNVNATVLSQGAATVSAGGTVSGTVIGVGNVSVSGASDVAAAFSGGAVSASGAQSGAAVAASPTGSNSASAAATQQQVAQSTESNSQLADNGDSDELKKKRAKDTQLMEYVGRVTVLLPE
jgi:filamentous hemagglutinin family protein